MEGLSGPSFFHSGSGVDAGSRKKAVVRPVIFAVGPRVPFLERKDWTQKPHDDPMPFYETARMGTKAKLPVHRRRLCCL